MQPVLIYCYDAYCGWCYGFSPVIKRMAAEYAGQLHTEVLSGGMVLPESPVPISATASYIRDAYKTVEEMTGIRFGADYLWHIHNPEQSDWFPSSELPAIALCILKEMLPDKQAAIASDLQYALHHEGRDLTDKEAYRHLLQQYGVDAEDFYRKISSDEYKEKAYYEFQLCKQLQVTGFPQVLLQETDSRFHLLARGYTDYETLKKRLDLVLTQTAQHQRN
ncbi:MAG TPA: DsbA family protein [Lacibacter sp.]|nr:DsbA family protein [Lacibacter sp.]HMO88409.1 DsbA family protein [Lacibacter sp.]HMP86293.1 DsbA family protein [Lacibacter sp.]